MIVYYNVEPTPWWGWLIIALVFWVIPAAVVYWMGGKL
jgi:hypothetical protein